MDRWFYEIWWLKPICKLMRVIPISADDPPKKIVTSLREARTAMDEGFMVCIFAEGVMTRTGMLQAFKGGFERIMRGSNYSIIPAYLGGAWGSIFSYYHGKPLKALPTRFPYPVSFHFGKPMDADSSSYDIRRKVMELSCDYFQDLKAGDRNLTEQFIRSARKNKRRKCLSDSTGKKLNYTQTLISSIALSAEIKKLIGTEDKVGLLLPPSVAGALANIAVPLAGKAPVNLNYSAPAKAVNSAIEQCGIKRIISSRKFIEKIKFEDKLHRLIFLEDIVKQITPGDKFKALLKAKFIPRRILAQSRKFNSDSLATVIFSSGSTGLPKGVMLSHHNILSNIESTRIVFHLKTADDLCGVLPFFHSFGFTCTLWFVLVSGISASYIPNPLDAAAVGKSVRENNSTILFAAPTFLLSYLRRVNSEDFTTLREVLVGAEKLKKRLADSFEKKFSNRPLEGYGATELSPVASLNVHDVQSGDVFQQGTKEGTVGQPIPGVAVKFIDPQTGEEAQHASQGLLQIKGPNVMLGYLGKEEETAEVLKDGWYNTGDLANMDEDGFLTITGRLSRFSKIGGEMVPHLALEELCLNELGTHEHIVAVTSVPDYKKGEELILLYTDKAGDPDKLYEIVSKSNLPNICKPKQDNYIKTDSIPVLGSGKLDLMKLRKIAIEAKTDS